MQQEFDYEVIDMQHMFAVDYCSVQTEDLLDFSNVNPNVISLYATPFSDLKDSIIETTKHNLQSIVVEQLDVVSLCELIASTISRKKTLEINFIIYDNFEVARKNMVNSLPVYSENEHLLSFMLLERFTAYKRMIFCVFTFMSSFNLKNFTLANNTKTYSKEAEYELNKQYLDSVRVKILKLK